MPVRLSPRALGSGRIGGGYEGELTLPIAEARDLAVSIADRLRAPNE